MMLELLHLDWRSTAPGFNLQEAESALQRVLSHPVSFDQARLQGASGETP